VFELKVSRGLLLTGIVTSTVVGLLGGLMPAVRAARMPIIDALRTR